MSGFSVVAVRFEVHGAALNAMLSSPAGPVGLELLKRANEVKVIAQTHCPVEDPVEAARRHRRPGRLRDSIQVRREEGGLGPGLVFLVGSDLVYARRIEFNRRVGGFLRGAIAAVGGPHSLNAQLVRLGRSL